MFVCKRSKKEKLHYYVTPSQTKQPHVILINPTGMRLAPLLTFNINKFMRPCIKSSDLQQSYDRASRMIAANLLGLQKKTKKNNTFPIRKTFLQTSGCVKLLLLHLHNS